MFSSIFTKGDNFSNFLFAIVNSLFLPKEGQLLIVRFAPRGANSFLSELTTIQKGGKNERVASTQCAPIHLNFLVISAF